MNTSYDASGSFRTEQDSLGEVSVPENALYGAQTQRAVDNFKISGQPLPAEFIHAVARIKKSAAIANQSMNFLTAEETKAISDAADSIVAGKYPDQFPIDVYQTGSGTSTNMNVNEVIVHIARQDSQKTLSPNDHVNKGQSSNDVIPSAIHVVSAQLVKQQLLPALETLEAMLDQRAKELENVAKTGRTHLMDAMPVTMGQELSGWKAMIQQDKAHIVHAFDELCHLTLGGTAVGTGTNTDPAFAGKVCQALSQEMGITFSPTANFFAAQSLPSAPLALSAALKGLAATLMKIANDLRWMNSGPFSGLGEIALPVLQPGSSIMPGKVNPVIPEAVAMVAAQLIGFDAAVTIATQSGSFQLNVMLPLIANNLVQGIQLASNACTALTEKALAGFEVRRDHINESLYRNPILVTALNPIVGYMKAAKIAKRAYAENRSVIDVACDETDMDRAELEKLLNPVHLTKGGISK